MLSQPGCANGPSAGSPGDPGKVCISGLAFIPAQPPPSPPQAGLPGRLRIHMPGTGCRNKRLWKDLGPGGGSHLYKAAQDPSKENLVFLRVFSVEWEQGRKGGRGRQLWLPSWVSPPTFLKRTRQHAGLRAPCKTVTLGRRAHRSQRVEGNC